MSNGNVSDSRIAASEFVQRYGCKLDTLGKVAELAAVGSAGPWLVGGSVRRFVAQLPQDSDFDLAFSDEDQLNSTLARISQLGLKQTRDSRFHVQLEGQPDGFKKPVKVQLLRIAYYASPEAAIDSFDFTICQFAYDGADIVSGRFALYDLARKRLQLHRLTYGASTVRRLLKYTKQGYTACQGTFVSILQGVVDNPAAIQEGVEYVD